ncbi:MAG: O-antigen ligase domain-containing protein [Candidatus Dadabacteria bacterium]|nr:MAG: O-antigen ligase domain-containing protein [Candidatus Dadabacteria bacterium]
MALKQSVYPAEGEVIEEFKVDEPPAPKGSVTAVLPSINRFGIVFIMLYLPLAFGGVHRISFLVASLVLIVLLMLNFYAQPKLWNQLTGYSRDSFYSWSALLCLSLLFLYVTAQGAFLIFTEKSHSVLGLARLFPDAENYFSFVRSVLFALCAFMFTLIYLRESARNFRRVIRVAVISGLIVSLVGISHWFYDNGKLFWLFEPDYIFTSTRARWPFVNSNHLGHFLLPLFFLTLSEALTAFTEIAPASVMLFSGDRKIINTALRNKKLQSALMQFLVYSLILISIAVCIAATLSRSSWFGLGIGLVLFVLLSGRKEKKNVQPFRMKRKPSGRQKRVRRSRSIYDSLPGRLMLLGRLVKPLLLVLGVSFILFFLYGRGIELISDRLEYGLMYSKTDMRWQLYRDTLPMLKGALLFGVGAGAWQALYPLYMDTSLSGINPVYLHSDPLQLLTELGVAGTLPLAALVLIVSLAAIKALRVKSAKTEYKNTLLCLLCGQIGLLAASFFDFPFRMPAIVFYTAVCLSLTLFCIDRINLSGQEIG